MDHLKSYQKAPFWSLAAGCVAGDHYTVELGTVPKVILQTPQDSTLCSPHLRSPNDVI